MRGLVREQTRSIFAALTRKVAAGPAMAVGRTETGLGSISADPTLKFTHY
jgi:hypothetical protein